MSIIYAAVQATPIRDEVSLGKVMHRIAVQYARHVARTMLIESQLSQAPPTSAVATLFCGPENLKRSACTSVASISLNTGRDLGPSLCPGGSNVWGEATPPC